MLDTPSDAQTLRFKSAEERLRRIRKAISSDKAAIISEGAIATKGMWVAERSAIDETEVCGPGERFWD